ncbi:recombinase family protein [Saccharopolyspora sp. NPDC049426]|uniref:recombinase family protein n=1 Tax=Saccharopolyspora sp. NPDC049426 TaxID=3155652 RepID=UPI00341C38A0
MDVSEIRTAREYLRVSQDRSGRGKSNQEQHSDNVAAADRNGWTLGEAYEDRSISASRYTKKAREGYDQLIADLESGTFSADALIIWESSRGSRRVGEWVLLCDLLEERGKFVHVTTHGRTYNPRNPRDRRSLLEDAVDSEYESGKQSSRIARDAAAAATAGRPPTRGAFGHPRRHWIDTPLGRERITVPEDEIERERAAVLATYDGLFAGKTLVSLARELDNQGFRTTRGGKFTRTEVRAMLLNPRNAGIRFYKGERLNVETAWEPIVSEETWQAAVHFLSDPKRRQNHGTARRWMGGGLYRCGVCNESDMRVNYRDDGRVYRCRATGHNSRHADKVDAFVLTTVAERLRRDDVAELLAETGQKSRAAELRTEAHGLRKRLDSLGVEYATGALTAGQVRTATDHLESRMAEVNSELASLGRTDQLTYLFDADDAGQRFLDQTLDVQRATVAALCTVTLQANRRGRWALMSDTVDIDFNQPSRLVS